MGVRGLKSEKKSVFWLLEDKLDVQIHIRVKFNGTTKTTEGEDRFLQKKREKAD